MADQPIEWSIKEIKELEFFVDETQEIGNALGTNYLVTIDPVVKDEQVHITFNFSFVKSEGKETVMKCSVKTVYLIRNLKDYSSKVNGAYSVNLPDPLWFMLFGIAFTHTRAIFARAASGSKFSNLIMPPINPEAEFKKVLGKYLESDNKTNSKTK